jgi:hypothetical protein
MTTMVPVSPAATPIALRSSALTYQTYPYTSSNLTNRQACFFADDEYRFYLDWLVECASPDIS